MPFTIQFQWPTISFRFTPLCTISSSLLLLLLLVLLLLPLCGLKLICFAQISQYFIVLFAIDVQKYKKLELISHLLFHHSTSERLVPRDSPRKRFYSSLPLPLLLFIIVAAAAACAVAFIVVNRSRVKRWSQPKPQPKQLTYKTILLYLYMFVDAHTHTHIYIYCICKYI